MNRTKTILGHLVIWLCMPFMVSFVVWIFFRSVFSIENDSLGFLEVFSDKGNILNNFIIVFCGALGFYAANYSIASDFLHREKTVKIAFGIGTLLLAPVIFIYVLDFFFKEVDHLSFFIAYPVLIFFFIVGALLRVLEYGRTRDLENARLKQKSLETQLHLLKTQINPHFLFNTINNIDVLIENNPKVASDYLRKLGDLLRFMLYRVNEVDRILLKDEIEYLKKYIDLQKIRSVNPNFVDFTIKGNPVSVMIAPMIFVVFVENAFKHVVTKKEDRAIVLCMEISSRKLFFRCRNIIGKKPVHAHTREGGMGLTSVKRRLDLIYRDNYKLNISSDSGYYEASLEIELP